MRRGLIAASLLFLLAGAFLDNVRGPLLPLLRADYHLTYTQTSGFLVAAYAAALVSALSMISLMNRFGEHRVSLASAVLCLATCAVAHLVDSYPALLVFGALIGGSVATTGAACNVLMMRASPPAKQSRLMCGLHAMYGLGSLMAPVTVTWTVGGGLSWPWALSFVPPTIVLVLFGVLLLSRDGKGREIDVQPAALTQAQAIVLAVIACYVGGEVVLSMWLSPFLEESLGLGIADSAAYLGGFFAMMALTRGACFFLVRESWEWRLMVGSLVAGVAGFSAGRLGWLPGFLLAGAVGPFFPLFLVRMGRRFPGQWRSITLWILVSMQCTLALCHFSVGRLTDLAGIETAYWIPLWLFLLAILGARYLQRSESRAGQVGGEPGLA